jgi:transcriptional regulator with XRE-family HTH domain
MNDFHERFKELRDEKGETQTKLAEVLGITAQALSYYVNGREPNFDLLCDIADYYGITTDYLLGLSEYKNFDEQKLADNLTNGHANDLSPYSQKLAVNCYKDILDCLIEYENYYKDCDIKYNREIRIRPGAGENLILGIKNKTELYKTIAKYLQQEKSMSDILYKFGEMHRGSDESFNFLFEISSWLGK